MGAFSSIILATAAALSPGVTGTWDLNAGDTTIFRFEVTDAPTGGTATWERPERFETDGETFSGITGPAIRRRSSEVRTVDGDLELTFDDPAPHSRPDVFRIHVIDGAHARATYEGMEPFDLVRPAPNSAALGPWMTGRSYSRTIVRPTNAEMTAIFDADQADRQAANIDWSKVGPADDLRLTRTRELLAAGMLQSGDDYYHAAFVFQHGNSADDFLTAHLLAMIAVARGKPAALWIASATLDRYLRNIDRPQVLGTQYTFQKDGGVTQEPYDRALVSDAMRKALRVRTLPEQEQQKLDFAKQASEAKKP